MMISWSRTVLLLVLAADAGLCAPRGAQEEELWGYVDVREGAHMFWWLYPNDSPPSATPPPLVMWLQGGPGGSGSGFGNFEEIGPLDRDLQPRKTNWVQTASVLFVDNPVGTGFSYADSPDAFARDLKTVASDMMVLLQHFFTKTPQYQDVPFYIFSESYGGKMAAGISLELQKAVQEGSVKCNFAGVALGDSWISPLDSVLTWGPYLYTTSLLDDHGLAEVSRAAGAVQEAVQGGDYLKATELWSNTESVVEQNTNGVNFYNILTQDAEETTTTSGEEETFLTQLVRRHVEPLQRPTLAELMNGPIRKKLGIIPQNVTWGGQSARVFTSMAGDFMRPVVDVVDQLLEAGVNVTVYNGQLDLIVDTMGQEQWVKQLKWAGLAGFTDRKWTALDDPVTPGVTAAFYKTYKNLSFYWILRAGHMIPSDQPPMAFKMLRMVTQQD